MITPRENTRKSLATTPDLSGTRVSVLEGSVLCAMSMENLSPVGTDFVIIRVHTGERPSSAVNVGNVFPLALSSVTHQRVHTRERL